MKAQEIKGTITLTNGEVVQFNIFKDSGWQQWGNTREVHGEAVEILETMAQALGDEGLLVSDSDEEDDDEDNECWNCGCELASDGACTDDTCDDDSIDFGEMVE